MSIFDYSWSKPEKKIARAAFDKAYQNEIASIRRTVEKMIRELKEDYEIWKIEDYLGRKRAETDEKYDYRYSQLILVFARLIADGFLTLSDLSGLSEEKLESIKRISEVSFD